MAWVWWWAWWWWPWPPLPAARLARLLKGTGPAPALVGASFPCTLDARADGQLLVTCNDTVFDVTCASRSGVTTFANTTNIYHWYLDLSLPGMNSSNMADVSPDCFFSGYENGNAVAQYTSVAGCFALGNVAEQTWTYFHGNKSFAIHIAGGQPSDGRTDYRTSQVVFSCDPDAHEPVLEFYEENPLHLYHFGLKHRSACGRVSPETCQWQPSRR